MQVVAISVDPVGDTPKAVRAYLACAACCTASSTWSAAAAARPGLGEVPHRAEPDPKLKRLVGHTGIVIGIDAGGKERTYYPPRR